MGSTHVADCVNKQLFNRLLGESAGFSILACGLLVLHSLPAGAHSTLSKKNWTGPRIMSYHPTHLFVSKPKAPSSYITTPAPNPAGL